MVPKITGSQIMKSVPCFLLMAAVFLSLRSPVFSQSIPLKITLVVPTQSLDFSDLDMRDEFNRPVKTPSASAHFSNFVALSLHEMLLRNMTPLNRSVQDRLNRKIDWFVAWLRKQFHRAEIQLKAWLMPNKQEKPVPSARRIKTDQEKISFKSSNSNNRFHSLISSLLSSIQILR